MTAFCRRAFALAATLLAFSIGDARADNILLVGNSFTTGLKPYIVSILKSSGRSATVITRAMDGYTLEQHLGSAKTMKTLRSKSWDAVVLQEQSLGEFHVRYPAARELDQQIRAIGAQTVFMMTWRDRDQPLVTYDSLRGKPGEDVGYVPIASELGAPIAPVGWVFREQLLENSAADLWSEDGHHASERGRYLAALSIYCAMYGESPVGLWAPTSFTAEQIRHDQLLVERVALSNPDAWMIDAATAASPGKDLRKAVSSGSDDSTEVLATGAAASSGNLSVGSGLLTALRFAGLPVPAGASVRSAHLEFYPSTGRTNSIVVEYTAVATDDAPPLSTQPGSLSKLPVGSVSVVDAPPAFNGGTYNKSADLAELIEEIVSRPGWQQGNALTLLVADAGSSAARSLRSFESGANRAATLVIELE